MLSNVTITTMTLWYKVRSKSMSFRRAFQWRCQNKRYIISPKSASIEHLSGYKRDRKKEEGKGKDAINKFAAYLFE